MLGEPSQNNTAGAIAYAPLKWNNGNQPLNSCITLGDATIEYPLLYCPDAITSYHIPVGVNEALEQSVAFLDDLFESGLSDEIAVLSTL
jgi:hypothetical protein